MISSIGFVPSGVLNRKPTRANVTAEDLEALKRRLETTMGGGGGDEDTTTSESSEGMVTEEQSEAARAATETATRVSAAPFTVESTGNPSIDEALKEMRFEEYDTQNPVSDTSFLEGIIGGFPPDDVIQGESPEEESDDQSIEFGDTDIVFVTTKTEDILSSIEIWIYEEADDVSEGNLLPHHDIPLSHFPLCCAYLTTHPGSDGSGNFMAVGCMECGIEIYDLDVRDPIAPLIILSAPSKKKKLSTMTLDINDICGNVMASGGDDKRLRVWDVDKGEVTRTTKLHKSTIQCVKWNPVEAPILVSGGHDKKCAMIDVRSPDGKVLEWRLEADNESLAWCLDQATCFLASDEEGTVSKYDARNGTKSDAVFSVSGHKESVTVVDVSPLAPSLFMTGSADGKVKIWDMASSVPVVVDKQTLGIGEVLAGGFCRSADHLLVAGGENGNVEVWDLRSSPKVVGHFPESVVVPRVYRHRMDI